MQRGMLFNAKLPVEEPVYMNALTEFEMNYELEKGYKDFLEGNVMSANEAFAAIRKDYGL